LTAWRAVTAVAAALTAIPLAAGPLAAAPTCSVNRVDLRWPGGSESFAVEVADEPAERSTGLMFRETLDPASGMLFVYEAPRRSMFWMKNTLVPLDMIFADETGTVTRVHSNAVPLDETPVDGGEGVVFVLEVNGGLANRLGIGPGAELRHPAIGDAAAWTCD
jgi:uncharacterized protein